MPHHTPIQYVDQPTPAPKVIDLDLVCHRCSALATHPQDKPVLCESHYLSLSPESRSYLDLAAKRSLQAQLRLWELAKALR